MAFRVLFMAASALCACGAGAAWAEGAVEPSRDQGLAQEQMRLVAAERDLMREIAGEAGIETESAAAVGAAPNPHVSETPAGPFQPRRFEDRRETADEVMRGAAPPAAERERELQVRALESAIRELRAQNNQMRALLESLQNKAGGLPGEAVSDQPKAQFLPSGWRGPIAPALSPAAAPVRPRRRHNQWTRTPAQGKALVISTRAVLRAGPSLNSTRLMTLAPGARVAVELNRGEWIRVVTPTGTRAWVQAEVLALE